MTFVAVAIAGSAIVGGVVANNSSRRAAAAQRDAAGASGTPQWLQNQQQLFANLSNQQYNQQFNPYGGQRVADLNNEQLDAINHYRGAPTSTALTDQGSAALSDMLGPYKENPALQGMINLSSKDISAGMGAAGLGSGSFGNAGVAQQGANALADSSTKLRFQDYNNYMDRRLNATQGAAQYGQNLFNNYMNKGNALLQGGNLGYANQQAKLDVPYQDYLTDQNWNLRQLGILQNAAQIGAGNTPNVGPLPNTGANTLGGALLGGQMGGQMAQYFNRNQTGQIQPGMNQTGGWGYTGGMPMAGQNMDGGWGYTGGGG